MLALPPRPASSRPADGAQPAETEHTAWSAVHDSAELRLERRTHGSAERARAAAARIQAAYRARSAHGEAAAKASRAPAAPSDGFDSPPFELDIRFARRRPIGEPVETSLSMAGGLLAGSLAPRGRGHLGPPLHLESSDIERPRAYGLSPDGSSRVASPSSPAGVNRSGDAAAGSAAFGTPPAAHSGEQHLAGADGEAACAGLDLEPSPCKSPCRPPPSAHKRGAPPPRRAAHGSEEKLHSILAFLEHAEATSAAPAAGPRARTSVPEPPSAGTPSLGERGWPDASARAPRPPQLEAPAGSDPAAGGTAASALYSGVKAKMAALKQQLADEAARAARLQLELSEARQHAARREAEADAAAASCAQAAKSEHEVAVTRHLGFIDRLLADKAELARQVESLQAQSAALEAKFEQRLRAKDETVARELRRRVEAAAIADRAKREQWMVAKSKEIKELTIRGLEPDIQRLIEKHRDEVRALAESTRAAVAQAVEAERAACARELKAAGARADEAVDKAVARERAAAAESAERAHAEAEAAARAARKAMLCELEEAREAAEAARRREGARHEAELRETRAGAEAQLAEARASAAAGRQGASEALQAERGQMRREMEAEHCAWLEGQRAQLAADAARAEERLAAAAAAKRDAEVSKVIGKLSDEMARTKREIQADAARRVDELVAGAQREEQAAQREAADARARAEQASYLYEQLRSQLERTTAAAADTASERERLRAERSETVRARRRQARPRPLRRAPPRGTRAQARSCAFRPARARRSEWLCSRRRRRARVRRPPSSGPLPRARRRRS